ncbi:hypothetical protein SAMN05443579_112127 [Variovorax sp. PDC80]|uniref:hypothetical protein n=1 Tax=Variovorax sp. PDC80 TaxID=1882827 RepID=UPI0008F320D0|nr:hypothetical protein [Variovorax sp. PDC80]SFP54093.1 hypothetical protein SAMN05443579_112127 [Variovorax sp. PDC80]
MLLHSLTRRERGLAFFLGLLLLIGIVGPVLPAAEVAIALVFADTRAWHGLPNAMDVLSNLPFLLMGCWGLYWLNRIDRAHHEALSGFPLAPPASDPPDNTLDCAWLFFAGLIATAAGSAFYHLAPDAPRLAADRAGMAVAFAGLIGMAVCERVSQRAGWPAAWFVLTTGLLSAEIAQETGNVLPWALVQFGGMALVLTLALSRPISGAVGLRLGWVIAAYVLAKAFELADQPIYEATQGVISGHTLKHLCAALAALPVLTALQRLDRGWRAAALRHNPGAAALTA